jgi:hypothetical protein
MNKNLNAIQRYNGYEESICGEIFKQILENVLSSMENFEGLANEQNISQNRVCDAFKLPMRLRCNKVYVIDCFKNKH